MKNTTHFQLFFTMFFVASITASNQAVEQDSASGYQKEARATSLTAEQKSQAATDTLIKYFEQMIEKNILGITGLERLAESPNIINPILPEQYHTSDLVDTYKNQLDTLIEKGKDFFDLARVKVWAQAKIQELEHRERTRQRVHEETREVHIPMRFIEVPAGKYEDIITHEKFEIISGTEIQETPVTQLQWAQVMGNNPSHFVGGIDSEEVLIGGKKIKMRPGAPVENVSYNQVQEFITKLNEHDKNNTNYIYALPSVQEYQALMQSVPGSNWLERVQHMKTCDSTEKTCTVTSGDYMLTSNKQRIFGLVGGVWQWTRDMVDLAPKGINVPFWRWIRKTWFGENASEIHEYLVFGSSYAIHKPMVMNLNTFLRPVLYCTSKDKNIGIRLVRYTKGDACELTVIRYHHELLSWNEKDVENDHAWHWSQRHMNIFFKWDDLEWMIKHKSDYPQETQRTIDVLLKQIPDKEDPIEYLEKQKILMFIETGIEDLSPFASLINLTELNLGSNQIKDLSPLANLTNLTDLELRSNKIKDLLPLASLTKLHKLGFSGTQLQAKDLLLLANLTNLTELDLGNNQIKDVSPLANFTNLTKLNLDYNQIQDLSPLANLTNLTGLNLDFNQIQDLSPLVKLTNLAHLQLWNNQIQDLSPLANLTNLTELALGSNQIKDLSPLANLTNLKELWLRDNPIKDFLPLSQLKNLKLSLNQNQLKQLGANVKSILPHTNIDVW